MKFFQDLQAGIYSPNFVSRFKSRTFNQAVLFIFILVLILTLITEVIILSRVVSPFTTFVSGDFITRYYPQDLDVTITNGLVTTNQANPYLIANPDSKAGAATSTTFSNIVVIDTNTTDPISAVHKYNTYVLVTQNAVVTESGSGGEIRVIPLTNVKNFYLTQTIAQEYFKKAVPYLYGTGVLAIIVLPVLITAFTTIWDLFLLLGFALIVWFIAKIRKVEVGYKESYILSGYLLALPTIANFVLGLITPASQWILTIILFALIAVLNIKQEKSSI